MVVAVLLVLAAAAVIIVVATGTSSGPEPRKVRVDLPGRPGAAHAPRRDRRTDDHTAARAGGGSTCASLCVWLDLAPASTSTAPPGGFDASDPASYPASAWGAYDRVVKLPTPPASVVDFNVTAPGPQWAMQPGAPNAKDANHWSPSANAYGQFMTALGRRYSGNVRAGGSEPSRCRGSISGRSGTSPTSRAGCCRSGGRSEALSRCSRPRYIARTSTSATPRCAPRATPRTRS